MALFAWVRDLVSKYSFITSLEFRNGSIHLHYKEGEKEKSKRLPYRTNRDQLIHSIEKIKNDVDYYEQKRQRWEEIKKTQTTDSGFAFLSKRVRENGS